MRYSMMRIQHSECAVLEIASRYDSDMEVALQSMDVLLRAAAAEFLLLAFLYIGNALSRRFFSPSKASVRWSVTILVSLYVATLAFHFLLATRQFRPVPAVLLIALNALLIHRFVMPVRDFALHVVVDLENAARWLYEQRRHWQIVPVVVFICLGIVTVAKTLLIPPLGWDSLVYHSARSAFWVQAGGPATLHAPGGWSYYPLYVGGSELLSAWAMLPFHSDLMVAFFGALLWLAVGLLTFSLGRFVELSRWNSLAATVFVLFVPAVHRCVGSDYSEPALTVAVLGAVLMGCIYFLGRKPAALLLSLAMLGVAAGAKSTGYVMAAFGGLLLLAGILSSGEFRRRHLKWYVAGALLALLAVAPWWIHAYLRAGYPLSPMPLKIFGVTLGKIDPAWAWLNLKRDTASTWLNELNTLKTLFAFDVGTPRLGPFVILPILLFPAGLVALGRKTFWPAVWLAGMFAGVVVSFYHPGLALIRINWAPTDSRFLFALLPLAVVGSSRMFRGLPRFAGVYSLVLVTLAVVQAAQEVFWGVSGVVLSTLPVLAVCIITLVLGSLRLLAMRSPTSVLWMMVLLPLLVLPFLSLFRDRTRADVFADEGMMTWHYTLRYWSDAACITDDPARSVKVAVTSAPWQNQDSWLCYPFLGRRFQNTLVYVPITASGWIGNFDGTKAYQQGARYEAWLSRLREWGVAYVMSFWPTSIELAWMRQHPERFEELSSGEKWGFYRVR